MQNSNLNDCFTQQRPFRASNYRQNDRQLTANSRHGLIRCTLRHPVAYTYLGVKPKTLSMWQLYGKGPISVLVGGRRFYFKDALDAYVRGDTDEAA